MLGKSEEKRAAEDEMDSITDSVDMNLSKLWETVEDRGAWRAAVHGVTKNWVDKIPWRRDRLPTPVFLGFPCGSAGKESACNVGDLGSIRGLGRPPGEGKGYPLQYSGLENSLDCIVHGVAKSRTRLSDFHFHFSN